MVVANKNRATFSPECSVSGSLAFGDSQFFPPLLPINVFCTKLPVIL